MNLVQIILLTALLSCAIIVLCNEIKESSIVIVILIRNKAYTLPYFFTYLDNLNYPKERISLWIRSDYNEDESITIIETWLNYTRNIYNEIDFKFEYKPERRPEEISSTDWPNERFIDLIRMKEEGFEFARKRWADYVLFLDADVILTSPDTLTYLISLKLPLVAPMLLSDGLYSNFWGGVDEEYYYKRTDEYQEILEYKKVGEFPVPMIHSAVLVDLSLKNSDLLTFDPVKLSKNQNRNFTGAVDDMIVFGLSANNSKLQMYISNSKLFGYISVPLGPENHYIKDWYQMINIKTNIINYAQVGLLLDSKLAKYVKYPEMDSLTLNKIFMINLDRRTDRKEKMEKNFFEIGLKVERIPAVDGKNLSYDSLAEMGITLFPDYKDPYHKRPMTLGEVGCFLSHYNIWKRIVDEELNQVLVLEDDIRFDAFFKTRAVYTINQARKIAGWDLLYFGRKRLHDVDEPWVETSNDFVVVDYSYWTLGYLITLKGAHKLMKMKPLEKIVPVDEFLPIAFNKHPNKEWMEKFSHRSLIAYSVAPLLIYPTHYTGEDGYISDTEDSSIINIDDDVSESDVKKKGDKEESFKATAIPAPESNEESDCQSSDAKCSSKANTDRTEL